jgi:hypothetical protein
MDIIEEVMNDPEIQFIFPDFNENLSAPIIRVSEGYFSY